MCARAGHAKGKDIDELFLDAKVDEIEVILPDEDHSMLPTIIIDSFVDDEINPSADGPNYSIDDANNYPDNELNLLNDAPNFENEAEP